MKHMEDKYKKYSTLVLELNGTLIETTQGDSFPKGIWGMKFNWGVMDSIGYLLRNVKYILVVSDQSNIFSTKISYVATVLENYLKLKYEHEVIIDARYYPDNSFTDLNPTESILFIGNIADKECTKNLGMDYMDVEDFIKEYNITKIINDV